MCIDINVPIPTVPRRRPHLVAHLLMGNDVDTNSIPEAEDVSN